MSSYALGNGQAWYRFSYGFVIGELYEVLNRTITNWRARETRARGTPDSTVFWKNCAAEFTTAGSLEDTGDGHRPCSM